MQLANPVTATPVTLGVYCRDQVPDLRAFADSLNRALHFLPEAALREVIIAASGAPDFLRQVRLCLSTHPLARHNLKIISSPDGKLAAQRAILNYRALHGYVGFVDSDVILEPQTLKLLWQRLESDPFCVIACGQPLPILPRRRKSLHQLLHAHYMLREPAAETPCLRSRTFLMRNWFWDDNWSAADCPLSLRKRLNLDRGPLMDDLALSRMAVSRWGAQSIQEVPEAFVHFVPPEDWTGFYTVKLQSIMESRRLDSLYPQHAAKPSRKQAIRPAPPSPLKRLRWKAHAFRTLYSLIEKSLETLAKAHVELITLGLAGSPSLFPCPVKDRQNVLQKRLLRVSGH